MTIHEAIGPINRLQTIATDIEYLADHDYNGPVLKDRLYDHARELCKIAQKLADCARTPKQDLAKWIEELPTP
jgi:hypothetical protein